MFGREPIQGGHKVGPKILLLDFISEELFLKNRKKVTSRASCQSVDQTFSILLNWFTCANCIWCICKVFTALHFFYILSCYSLCRFNFLLKKKKSTHNISQCLSWALFVCLFVLVWVFLSSLIRYRLFPTQKEFHLWYIQLIENDLERLTPVYRRSHS